MRHLSAAIIVTAGLVAAGAAGADQGRRPLPIPPAPAAPTVAFVKNDNRDRSDARFTTFPECRTIDPTDRDAKTACLQGQPWQGKPAQ